MTVVCHEFCTGSFIYGRTKLVLSGVYVHNHLDDIVLYPNKAPYEVLLSHIFGKSLDYADGVGHCKHFRAMVVEAWMFKVKAACLTT